MLFLIMLRFEIPGSHGGEYEDGFLLYASFYSTIIWIYFENYYYNVKDLRRDVGDVT
jgi:hypothetical protein